MSERDPKGVWMARNTSSGRGVVGIGRPLGQDQAGRLSAVTVDFPGFARGIDLRDAEQDQEAELTQQSADFVITERNRIKRAPGHLVIETMSGRNIRAMHVHTSLDFEVELLMFDGAWLGVKGTGPTTWYNASLPAGDGWVGIPNVDNFLFTNGSTGIYRRAFGGAGTVNLISSSPPAKTLANFAARVYAGGPTLGSTYQALAVAHSADAEGLQWTGLGSGVTFLIDNRVTDDRLIALRPMGFDLLAALCQKSIWIGRRTGDPFEPTQFEPRVLGQGCIAEPTVQVTPAGVVYLSESGVYVFDGNQATLLSAPINEELLPVLTNVLSTYGSSYEQTTARYKLYTPQGTWVYDLRYNRWLKHRYVAQRGVAFSEQFSGITWSSVLATWSTLSGTWASLQPPLGQERAVISRNNLLAVEANTAPTYIDGTTVEAMYGFLRRDTPDVNSLFETQRVRMRRVGGDPSLEIYLPNSQGEFAPVSTKAIPSTATDAGVELGLTHTGLGAGAQFRWTDPSLEISKVQLRGLVRSHAQGVL
jgi:hypothetical protein